ncbi:MAG TPA: hypoxanthine phosphoribosyltransferase [Bacteroidales bacterium]|nr:hypoxanthine phosphoribosyltransferase [Bacteroidales bacterium]HPT11712.1 hypoxanthine phosphoribosyltransferase [Bacteroidales bacterium]
MQEIKVLDKKFKMFIPSDKLQQRITELANEINNDLKGKDVVFFGILNGVFLFAADLFKRIDFPSQISFLKLASYEGTTSTGKIKELIGWNEDITGKTIVVIEDIVDTGNTLERIIGELALRKAKEVKIVTLLFKPEAYTKDIPLDYVGFEIPNNFVVGYGLDYDGFGRNHDSIYTLIK